MTELPSVSADIEQRLKNVEAELEAEKTKFTAKLTAALKAVAPHIPTYAALGYALLKHLL